MARAAEASGAADFAAGIEEFVATHPDYIDDGQSGERNASTL
jgi:hypothetical protein